nr:hypothetical protein [Tanacetum cinerariifolium]
SDSPDEIASPEYITPLPATSPFLYTDSLEASDYFDGPPSQDPYAIIVTSWRSRDHRPLGLFSIPTVIHSISMVAQETSTAAPVISFAAPVVETTIVASPTGLCSLVPYSD